MKRFGKVLTAMVTPFDSEGEVNYQRAGELASYLVERGSDGLVVCGTTGESPVLSYSEKVDMFKAVVDAVGGKATVVAGTGSYNTEGSIELTRAAERAGVDGVMLVVPYYNKPPQEGLYSHFATIAKSTSLPVMLYNVPSRTSRNMEPATVARLAEIKNVVAIKEASADMQQVAEIRRLVPADFGIYSGDDSLTLSMLALGACGVVSVASHLVGRTISNMIDAHQRGDAQKALSLHLRLLPLFRALFVTTNPIPVKYAVNKMGLEVGQVRLPLVPLSEKERKTVDEAMASLGLE